VDFFASQELARRNTRKLIFLLFVTVIALIGAIYGLVLLVFGGLSQSRTIGQEIDFSLFSTENGVLIAGVSLLVTSVVMIGSLFKIVELRKGGATVAQSLGGRRLLPNTSNFAERRILNIVEEMALASGVPVPPVYLLENEPGINAFAAGHTIDDAVIGINRGTLDQLNREELQGVIAHEFSHVLNGDMRMSLRMIGLLFGIQGIALIGSQMMRVASHMSNRSSRDKGNPAMVILVLGVGLFAIGSIGLFFARLIKASVSRQREFLADASAVQFTRLPDGISGALKMIGASSQSSRVVAPDAESISHMFFANMFGSKLQNFFATHPPLVPRIQRIEPSFNGRFDDYLKTRHTASMLDSRQEEREHQRRVELMRQFGLGIGGLGALPATGTNGSAEAGPASAGPAKPTEPEPMAINSAAIIANIGSPNNDDVVYSQLLVDHVPDRFLEDCREVFSARCIVFASLLHREPALRQQQLKIITEREQPASMQETVRQAKVLDSIPARFRLPIFEILQGSLTGMSPKQFSHFQETLKRLVEVDREVDLFEFFLLHHLLVHLRRHLGLGIKNQVKYQKLSPLTDQVELVLSIVARHGHESESQAAAAFAAGTQKLTRLPRTLSLLAGNWDFHALNEAIKQLAHLSFPAKKELLAALATTIISDQKITHTEAELFRAIAESLDCPVPPIVADKPVS
jgi:Zn-dependent protease with chaperone function